MLRRRKKKKDPVGPEPQQPSLPGQNPPPSRTPVQELVEADPLFKETDFLAAEFKALDPEDTRPGQNPPPMIEA
jgi:hypothetical protein